MSRSVSTVVTLVRHGRTEFNRVGIFRGRKDVPLDATGREQAQAVARVLGVRRPWFWRFELEPASITVLRHRPGHGYALALLNRSDHVWGEPGEREDA